VVKKFVDPALKSVVGSTVSWRMDGGSATECGIGGDPASGLPRAVAVLRSSRLPIGATVCQLSHAVAVVVRRGPGLETGLGQCLCRELAVDDGSGISVRGDPNRIERS
jgi:hypothetical protein